MKFKFDKNLDYQIEAIKSIVDIFDTGKNIIQDKNIFEMQTIGKVVSNELEIDKERILSNFEIQLKKEEEKLKHHLDQSLTDDKIGDTKDYVEGLKKIAGKNSKENEE